MVMGGRGKSSDTSGQLDTDCALGLLHAAGCCTDITDVCLQAQWHCMLYTSK